MTDLTELHVSENEIASLRHNLSLIHTQLQAGRVDGDLLASQVEKLLDVLPRIQTDLNQLRQQTRLEALYDVSRLLGSSLDIQVVLDQVMDSILRLTRAERGFLMLRNDDGQVDVVAARNLDRETLSSDKFEYSRTIVYRVMDTGDSVLTTNAVEDPRFSTQASIVRTGLRSIMATPLRVRGRVIGVIYVDNKAVTGLFEDADLAALETFAGQAAMTIDNAKLFSATDQQLAQRVEALQQLRRIDLQLTGTLDHDKAVHLTLDWAARLSEASHGHLGLLMDGHAHAVAHHGIETDDTQPVLLDRAYPQVMEAANSGKSQLVQRGSTWLLFVPARIEQQTVAVIVLRKLGAFTPEQQDLVERVAARGAVAIENARLYAAVKAADRAKSEFVGIVAHDLKVPMTSILGYADLTLMAESLPPELKSFQLRIRDTVLRMEMLVSDLADISRIESGHFFMETRAVSILEIVQSLRDATITQIKARDHQFIQAIEPDLPDMHVDYYRLLQILTNLVSNAYKYTPNGGTITLSAKRVGDRIEFSVADTGIGMSKEAVAKLGTKFWRSEDDFTRSQPGTGLGFAITKALIEQMGSGLYIESAVGQGSRFTFSVPIVTQ